MHAVSHRSFFRRTLRSAAILAGILQASVAASARAQTTPQKQPGDAGSPATAHATAYVPRQSDRPQPAAGDESGFISIFDGKTLAGWDGDPVYWRVEDGHLVGEVTPATLLKSNTFLVWQGGHPKDFELKMDYRISAKGNSGVNYRSTIVQDLANPGNRFAMRGYQFDLDGQKEYPGNNYEEKGRMFLAVRGQLTRVVSGQPPVLLAKIGDPNELAKLVTDDWNSIHLIVRGNHLIHLINGQLMSEVIDDDTPNRPADGLIGVQVHVGPPMKIEYRNIRLKTW